MAVLRVVGIDADHLLLLDPDGGGHRVAIDTTLHDSLKQAASVGTSRLTPREIQDRLRSGASVDQVADAAGVSSERIRRWEGPIRAERDRAVDLAQRTRYARPPDGAVSGPLGRIVTAHLEHHDLVGSWESHRDADGHWVVTVTHERGSASWRLLDGALAALDPQAEALGWREPPHAVDSVKEQPATSTGRRSRASIPSWEMILESSPPPNAFPT
ncbi:MAG TPA: septation protein SepH [Mycobacteriales bacterium]